MTDGDRDEKLKALAWAKSSLDEVVEAGETACEELVVAYERAADAVADEVPALIDRLREAERDRRDDPDRCSVEMLCDLLVEHLEKGNAGNYVDIANMAMMLHLRHAFPELLRAKIARLKAQWRAEVLEDSARGFMGRSAQGRHTLGAKNVADQLRQEAAQLRRQAEQADREGGA